MAPQRPAVVSLLCCVGAALAGCGAPGETDQGNVAEVRRIEGAPVAGPTPEHVQVALDPALVPSSLSLYYGAAAVGTSGGVLVGSLVTNTLQPLEVVPTGDDPFATGAVTRLAPRPSGGLFAVAEEGLFHDGQGVLLYSPLNAAPELKDNPLYAVDAAGGEDREELWIRTKKGAFHVAGGKIAGFEVRDAEGAALAVDALVGTGRDQAFALAGGDAYEIDLQDASITLVAQGIGPLHDAARAEDGAVYIASDTGLLVRDPVKGELSLHTLAAAGEPAVPVFRVAASFGTVVAATAKSIARIDADTAVHLVDLEGTPSGLTVDGQGDVWVVDGGKLVRHITGAPVSFDKDVKPFLTEHCAVCHQDGVNGAPVVDFADYQVAKERAPIIVKRLKGEGSVMPPVTFEVLTAADYAAVIRWVAGGLNP